MSRGLRLMIYDRTCRGGMLRPGLTHAWWSGAQLYRMLGRFDGYCGVTSWDEAWQYLATVRSEQPIAQVQYWGHGKWGGARVAQQVFDGRALLRDHAFAAGLSTLRRRMADCDDALFWFRTCETFGARAGHDFARELADFLGSRVAGHTYIIGHVQSGLHSLSPGAEVDWADDEGLREGSPCDPLRAHWSRLGAPNTITCLRGNVPPGF